MTPYNKIKSTIALSLVAIVGLSSCDKFLSEPPSRTTSLVVSTTDQLSALLNNYGQFNTETNRTAIYSTDDYELPKALYDARPATFSSLATVQFMLWDVSYLPDDTREYFWRDQYKKIFYANMALDYVGKVSGTEADKAAIKADAHLIRAYSYFELANTYCLPYTDQNKNEIGLPIKKTTSFEESAVRRPLFEVYELIEADLAEALKTKVALVQGGQVRHWRASTAGVHGFAARYFLNRNNYAKAIEHADAALQEYSTLVNYNTEMKYGRDVVTTIDAGTANAQTVTLKMPYTHDNQSDVTDMLGWKEFLYFRMLSHESWWYIPSQNLLDLYDKTNDLRYTYHIVEGYSYDRGLLKPSYSHPGYVFFFKDKVPSGPTVAEMLLIKAEALAHTNNASGAMAAINTLRASRMLPGAWVNLTATTQADAIKKVSDERRREMPFSSRWVDIRRYNNNAYAGDDITLEKTFYPYTNSAVKSTDPVQTYKLEKGSRRWAAPIPRTEMISSDGVITQNNY